MSWADEFRTMQVRANAETPADARQASRIQDPGLGFQVGTATDAYVSGVHKTTS